jgi:hypothetical protein
MDQLKQLRQSARTAAATSATKWALWNVWPASKRRSRMQGLVMGAGLLVIALGGCRFEAVKAMKSELIRQGHAATVDCLQAERAITSGDELRCEEWEYVSQNYLKPE